MVYVAGTIIYSVIQTLALSATVGVLGAGLIAGLTTAPLAVAFGSVMVRYTAAAWWPDDGDTSDWALA